MDERPTYDEKLGRILREAAAVFAQKGYHHASIRDIAAATGVSISGLYYYFKSKEELLFLIQDHCFGTILERLGETLKGVTDPEEKLRLFIRNHLRFFASNMKEMKVLSVEADALTGEYARKVADLKREYARTAGEILDEVRSTSSRTPPDDPSGGASSDPSGGASSDPSGGASSDLSGGASNDPSAGRAIDPKVATFSLFGMMNWIYTWYRPGRDVPVHRLADEMTHIFMEGFRSPVMTRPVSEEAEGPEDDPSIWRTP